MLVKLLGTNTGAFADKVLLLTSIGGPLSPDKQNVLSLQKIHEVEFRSLFGLSEKCQERSLPPNLT